jgi:glutaredoxin-related protein
MLSSLAIPHTITTIDGDDSFKEINQRSQLKTFPQVFIDGELIGGYDELSELKASGHLEEMR